MSDHDITDKILQNLKETSTIAEKKHVLEKSRVEKAYNELKESEKETERLKTVDVTAIDNGFLAKMDWEQQMMRDSISRGMVFVTEKLTEFVPFTYPNLILIGAKSGQGKSTFASNMMYQLLINKKKSLLLSNEEKSVDVYNRLSCLHRNWNYNSRKFFTDEQWDEMTKLRHMMYKNGRVRVIDSDYENFKDATTTFEGIKFILDNLYEAYLRRKKEDSNAEPDFDCIIIDYYQKVLSSVENPYLKHWEVLKKLSHFLDSFYKKYPAPVVVFCQLKKEPESDGDLFETRIKEGTSIFVPSTFAMELKPDKKNRTTEFIPHKHRWSERLDEKVTLVWKSGRFIDHTPEHDIEMAVERNEKEEAEAIANVRSRGGNE